MSKQNLLDIVNAIANDLDTDPVNDINDTVESAQIVNIVKNTYFALMANRNWPHLRRTIQFNSSLDTAKPTHLQLPEGTKELVSFSYNKISENDPTRDRFQRVTYMQPEEFLDKTNQRNEDLTNITKVTDFGGVPFYIYNDRQPTYYTSFDDDWIVLDAYNSALESTLTNSNTQAIVYFEPSWTETNTAIPDMPAEAFPLLIEDAKSMAFQVLKQEINPKSERRAKEQASWLSRKAWRVNGGVRYPDYGRK